ncbi:MAG: hypothetical protein M3460_19275 [Actinomycetota bacterium]|nr:hypothetical protein [Actinomycetota bacterium]
MVRSRRGEALAAEGQPNTAIADRLDVAVDVVSCWRKRFADAGSSSTTPPLDTPAS